MKSLITLISIFISLSAVADQCAWNDKAVADRARDVLLKLADIHNTKKPFILSHCNHCGGMLADEAYPTYLQSSTNTTVRRSVGITRADSYMVKVESIKGYDGQASGYYGLVAYDSQGNSITKYGQIDLAYAYVKTAPGVFMSLAYASGCQLMEEEPAFIYIDSKQWKSRIKSQSTAPFKVRYSARERAQENF